jgi:hypothetical protein
MTYTFDLLECWDAQSNVDINRRRMDHAVLAKPWDPNASLFLSSTYFYHFILTLPQERARLRSTSDS